jgi:hypothetical protein
MPNPLAVGLFHLPENALADRRRRVRIEIALRANREGYALLETFDTNGSDHGLVDALDAIRALADHHDVHALLILGPVDQQKVEDLAYTHTLIILPVPVPEPGG